MKLHKIPPHIVLNSSKEVIFYISNKCDNSNNISQWIKKLNLADYHGMVVNSKCIFNRLKDQDCK